MNWRRKSMRERERERGNRNLIVREKEISFSNRVEMKAFSGIQFF
jgi:hypothetical protein